VVEEEEKRKGLKPCAASRSRAASTWTAVEAQMGIEDLGEMSVKGARKGAKSGAR